MPILTRVSILLLVLTLDHVFSAEVQGEVGNKLAQAQEAQDAGKEATVDVVAKVIKEAPEAELPNGTSDVSTTEACSGDIENFCPTIKPGRAAIADCLSKQLAEEEAGNVQGKTLSGDCKTELAQFRIDLGASTNKNLKLAEACEKDATKFCSKEDITDPVAVLACLRDWKDEASKECQDEIYNTQEEGAKDYRTDNDLFLACQADAKRWCEGVHPGDGRLQDCLRDRAEKGSKEDVSWDCRQELLRQEIENSDDIRLSVRLNKKCQGERQKFCSSVKPGQARVKDCLEQHREEEGFGAECKAEFELMMVKRAADFRLDSTLRQACETDIDVVCGTDKDSLDEVENEDARVIRCLQDYREELAAPSCRAAVHTLMERGSQNILMDEPLAEACYADRKRFCDGIQQGSARVITCLQDARDDKEPVSTRCLAKLFDMEVQWAEDIDFKYPVKRSCAAEISKFCPGIQHGQARVVRCLQDHLEEAEMSPECSEEVAQDQRRSSQDYRLNYRLSQACEGDIEVLCGEECSGAYLGRPCGARVLRCLSDKAENVTAKACKDEVFYFQKMEVNDFRNDVLLAEACRTDVKTYCMSVQPGEGRVHNCLRENLQRLSEGCRKEELALSILESRDVRLRPRLAKACSEETATFCRGVEPGKGRVFKCLQESLALTGFGSSCREQVGQRGLRMQDDYRLDFGLSKACEADAAAKCSAEQGQAHGHAEVQKCLIRSHTGLSEDCQGEMARSVRMALWEYRQGAALTGVCDADIVRACPGANAKTNRAVWSIGEIGRCLSRQLAEGRPLGADCRQLVLTAAPKDAQAMFDRSMKPSAIAQRVAELQARAGIRAQLVNPFAPGAGIITLTGWAALAATIALFSLLVAAITMAYRRLRGIDKPIVIVTKEGDV